MSKKNSSLTLFWAYLFLVFPCVSHAGPAVDGSTPRTKMLRTVPPPTIDLVAVPSSIVKGQQSQITWTSTNAQKCKTSWESTGLRGTYTTPKLTTAQDFTVSCTNRVGQRVTRSVNVAILKSPLTASGIPIPSAYAGKEVVGRINAQSGQIIQNVHIISNDGPCIYIGNEVSNVTIRDSEIGPCKKPTGEYQPGIFAVNNSTKITIQRNLIHGVQTGAFFYFSKHPIYFDHNYVYDVFGPFPSGQTIQLHSVTTGTAGSKILCNVSDMKAPEATAKVSGVEDHISMWLSKGLANDRTEIAYNRVRGGNSKSGSAIQAGDGGGGNVWVHDNTIVNVGGGGAGIAGGQNITIERNRIFADGKASISGVGIYVKNYYPGTVCSNNIISNNRVYTWNSAWFKPAILESYGTDGSCTNTMLKENTFNDTTLNAAIFDEEYVTQCRGSKE